MSSPDRILAYIVSLWHCSALQPEMLCRLLFCLVCTLTTAPPRRVHVDQRSFPMSLEQYMDKMDGIAVLMNAWNRQMLVRTLLLLRDAKPVPAGRS